MGIAHPSTHERIKKGSKAILVTSVFLFLFGSTYEYFQVKNLPRSLRNEGGWTRLIFGDEIKVKEGIEELCSYLENGNIRISWDDTITFAVSGAHTCSCGHGERLILNNNKKKFYIKHDNFQQFGFLSIKNSGWREYCWRVDPELNNHKSGSRRD